MAGDNSWALKALRDFSRFLHGNWEKELVLIELLQILNEVIGCSRAGAYLYREGKLEPKANVGEPKLRLDEPYFINHAQNLISQLSSNNNSNSDPVFIKPDNLYMLPLTANGEIYGVIAFDTPKTGYNKADILSILTTLASVALKHATLADEKKKVEDVVSAFSSGLDIRTYYPRFTKKLRNLINYDWLTISIPNPFKGDDLIVYFREKGELKTKRDVYLGSASAWVISTGKPILEDDLAKSRNFPEDDLLLREGIRCALRVPIFSKSRVIGVLTLGSRRFGVYKKRETDLLTDIANKIGPAVENSLIYEAVNKKLGKALIQLDNTFSATLNALTVLLDRRDVGTKGHSVRVVKYAVAVAEVMGIQGKELENIRLGSLLHDIGKIGIPDSILFKPGRLNTDEWEIMKTHPEIGANMVSKIQFLSPATSIVLYHHEWFNGKGYPNRLAGNKIPLGARIFAIADAFDAMTSKRPYRDALSVQYAVEELKKFSGIQFCPTCVEAFMSIPSERLIYMFQDCHTEVNFNTPLLVGADFLNEETRIITKGITD